MSTSATTQQRVTDLLADKTVTPGPKARNTNGDAPHFHTFAKPRVVGTRPKERARLLCGCLLLGDWIVAIATISIGLGIRVVQRESWQTLQLGISTDFTPFWAWALGGGSLFTFLMIACETYEASNLLKVHRWTKNLVTCLFGWLVLMLAFLGLTRFTALAPRLGLFYCLPLLAAVLVTWRSIAFVFLMQPFVRNSAFARIVVVGWNPQVAQLVEKMCHDVSHMGRFVGCVPPPDGHFTIKPPSYVPVLGDYADLPQIVSICRATSIVLADMSSTSRKIEQLISFCHREYLEFQLVPEFFPALRSSLRIRNIDGVPLLGVRKLPLDRTLNRVVKRLCDIVGGAMGLILAVPVITIFGVMVYIESPGPIIYRQLRTTRSGRMFYIYKIRSMKINAESETGPVWSKRDDPRLLKIGAFMRKTNIDELPQFWNVLVGEMSLVGPRPERPELIERFKNEIPNYNVRHEAKAGLTGWAQIKGFRGDTDLGKRIELDLHYLEIWSPLLDLYCLLATFFCSKNAR